MNNTEKVAGVGLMSSLVAGGAAVVGAEAYKEYKRNASVRRRRKRVEQNQKKAIARSMETTRQVASMKQAELERINPKHLNRGDRLYRRREIKAQARIQRVNTPSVFKTMGKMAVRAGKLLSPIGTVVTMLTPTTVADATLTGDKKNAK